MGGEVEECEDNEPIPQEGVLGGKRLLYLYDYPGPGVNLSGPLDYLGPGGGVLRVRNGASDARALLDEHRVSCLHSRAYAGGDHADPVLVILYLFRYAYYHLYPPGFYRPCK